VIDLHLHTTASDGRCTPEALVQRAAAAGLSVIAVTDHDTTAGLAPARAATAAAGLRFVAGIEITAIEAGHDVHVLGYFIDPEHAGLQAFLADARASRAARIGAIVERLAAAGAPIDPQLLLARAARQDGGSVGRPLIARALVEAGHASDTGDAFERWLGRDRPGFVPRAGAPPERVIAMVHEAGGLASLAHPGLAGIDDRIPALRDAGLDAVEVYHSDHDELARERYAALAERLGLLLTGGSDYHGDPAHGIALGAVTLPAREWERLSTWPRLSSR
jgi:predicted metal-dependent phosphoesterase TrpH